MKEDLPEIVKRALSDTIVDIGQLSKKDKNTLNRYVKKGWLDKARGGPFPALKTVYAHPGYDFTGARQEAIDQAHRLLKAEKECRLINVDPSVYWW